MTRGFLASLRREIAGIEGPKGGIDENGQI
jgi:hypothetical protein